MDDKTYIIVVEDDYAVSNLITTTLKTENYQYQAVGLGSEAIDAVSSETCDYIMLLDLGLPDMDGVEVIKKIRQWSNMPIIVISARSDDKDKIEALDAGADDYLTKPFSVDELLARLRVTLRRLAYLNSQPEKEKKIFVNGDLKIDYISGCVYLMEKEIHLTPIEYQLLCLLARNVGRVLTHAYITNAIWGNSMETDVASLRVFMATLRKKVEEDKSRPKYIQTHVGVGYRMLRREEKQEV